MGCENVIRRRDFYLNQEMKMLTGLQTTPPRPDHGNVCGSRQVGVYWSGVGVKREEEEWSFSVL